MVYFGPVNRARQYFINMGYEPPNRQTTADFLVAVTDLYGRITRSGFEACAPCAVLEFAEYFKRSDIAWLNHEDMDTYMEEFVGKPACTSSRRARRRSTRSTRTRRVRSSCRSPCKRSRSWTAACRSSAAASPRRSSSSRRSLCRLPLWELFSCGSIVPLSRSSRPVVCCCSLWFRGLAATGPPWCPHGLTDSENDGDK